MGEYWYDYQLKRYVTQFAAIFGGLKVMTGRRANRDAELIDVPIIIAPRDRVAVSAASGFTQNKMLRIPMMSVDLSDIDMAPDMRKGTNIESREVFVPYGEPIQNAVTVYNRMATPFKLKMELSIYVSNKDQQFQILEQILPIFDPTLQIQTSDALLDKGSIVNIELLDISSEENFPPGTDSSVMMTVLSFQIDAYLSIPGDVKKNVVNKIIARIQAVNGSIAEYQMGDFSVEFDQQNIEEIIMAEIPPNFAR